MIFLPPPTEPVKQTFAISGLRISADMLASGPVTTLSTPGGSCSAMRCTTRVVASGAVNGGFTMTVLPASSACGSDAPRIAIGQLKGTMMDTTPSGWYDTVVCTGMAPGTGGSTFAVSTSSAWLKANFQRISNTSESTQASKRILPFSCERIAASASRFAPSMPCRAASIFSARCGGVRAAQAGYAAFAAATASRTSSGVAEAA